MKRRLFSLLLAALMLLSLLAACGQAETPAASDGDVQTDAPAPSEPETPNAETPAEPPGEVTLPIAAESTTYTMWVPNFLDAAMSYNDPNEFPIWQELERRTNIHIDWTLATLANAQEQFSLMLTSQSCTDLMAGAPSFLTGGIDYSIDEDIILDLTELVPEYMPNYYALLTADDYSRKTCYTDSGRLGQLQVVQDVPTILRWFDYLCTDEGFLLGNYGIEGTSYTLVDGEPVYTDLILANPDGLTRGQAQSLYSINTYITQYYDYTRGWGGTSEAALGCMDIWCADYDYVNSYDLPPVTLTIEETENLGSAVNDIATYVEEYSAQVVTGQKNLDATWDEYVAHIEAMNLQRCIEVYQAACDRFNAR